MKKEIERFQRALDASVIIALGKTILFAKYWEYFRPRLRTRNQQQLENARIAVREQFNSLADDLFFIPPEVASSEDAVTEYFQHKFEDPEFHAKFTKEIESKIRLSKPDLTEFFSVA